jgi:hypothetical protein
MHLRRIEMSGWQRADGRFEIEARLVDTKPWDMTTQGGLERRAGDALHDISIRWVVDEALTLLEVHACIDASPHPVCPEAVGSLQRLVGMRVGTGWSRAVRERMGPSYERCTHLTELLAPMASAAFQSLWPVRINQAQALDAQGRPRKIDSCLAYASDGDAVRVMWPEHARPRVAP